MYLQQQIGTCRDLAERASWEPCEWQAEPRWLPLLCDRGMRGGKVGKDRTGLLWDQISEDGAGLHPEGPGSHAGMGKRVREEGTAL